MNHLKNFVELNTEEAFAALEGHEDILTKRAAQRDRVYANLICPCCSSRSLIPKDKGSRSDECIPWHHFLCKECGCLFDPKTDLVLLEGNPPASLIET